MARTVIDENLLRDAFAYRTTEDDEEEAAIESKTNSDKGRVRIEEKGSSSNISRMSSIGEDAGTGMGLGTGTGTASRGGHCSGIVQKLRSQTASSSNSRCSSPSLRRSCSKDTGTDGSKVHDISVSESIVERRGQYSVSNIRRCSTGNSGGHRSSNMDIEGIVTDFEGGSTMRRLQRELTASKHSVDFSAKTTEAIFDSYHGEDHGSRK